MGPIGVWKVKQVVINRHLFLFQWTSQTRNWWQKGAGCSTLDDLQSNNSNPFYQCQVTLFRKYYIFKGTVENIGGPRWPPTHKIGEKVEKCTLFEKPNSERFWPTAVTKGLFKKSYSNEQSSFGQCKINFDRVLIRKTLFLENCKRYFKSDECSWDIIPGANLCPKVTFGLWPFFTLMAIFYH